MKIGFFSDCVLDVDIDLHKELKEKIRDNTFNVLNLEAPFIEDSFRKTNKAINLYHFTNNLKFLINNKFTYVNLANNHTLDFKKEGLQKTLNILTNNHITPFGAGLSLNESTEPAIIESESVKIGIWGFASKYTDAIYAQKKKAGVAPLTENIIKKTLSKYSYLDYKIAYFHYGVEFEDYPEPYFKSFFQKLIQENLFDTIIGNHSHSIQGVLSEEGKPIFYSLGNFIFPFTKYGDVQINHPESSKFGYFVNLSLAKNKDISYEIIPYFLENKSKFARPLSNTEQEYFFQKIDTISKPLFLNHHHYLQFYLKNRRRKYFPLTSNNEFIDSIKFWLFKKIEKIAGVLTKKIGIHSFIKSYLNKPIKNKTN